MACDVLDARESAALTIQRAWRARRREPAALDAEDRWQDASMHTKLQRARDAAGQGRNDPTKRWKRVTFLASRLHADGVTSEPELDGRMGKDRPGAKHEKILETQHWLELTDGKHRYGSNLKYYHRRWLEEDTEDNFFKWLDRGGGKDLSLPECSREQLEKERIIYLSPEQRLNYKVKIDPKGLLRWEKNNELVDTTAGRWQDSGDGSGIMPYNAAEREPPTVYRTSFEDSPSRSSVSSAVSAGSQDSQNVTHYVETSRKSSPVPRWIQRHLTVKGWTEMLLRKTVRRNTWIYVADRHFDLYIGIKDTGTFQHSSFLAGGLVVSAGLISVHKGLIHKLSPLSGHYRTKIDSFRHFLKGLEDRNVDLHRAEISRAELALWGIEHIKKFEKKKGDVEKGLKQKARAAVDELTPSGKDPGQDVDWQWRRGILLGRKKPNNPELAAFTNLGTVISGPSNQGRTDDCHVQDPAKDIEKGSG